MHRAGRPPPAIPPARRGRGRAGTAALLLALCAARAPADEAPVEAGPLEPDRTPALFIVSDSNAARFAIAEMRAALAAGQTVRGLRAAQRVLDEMPDDFHQEPAAGTESTLWRSAAEVVRERLAGLDAEQRAIYEALSQPSAAPLLERSLRARDEAGLTEVLRRFGAARAGQRAARVLADLAIESGRLRDAARSLREALRYRPRDPALWMRLIDALRLAGQRRELEGLALPAATDPGTPDAAALAARRAAALAALPERPPLEDLRIWGGTPARDGHAPAPPARELELRASVALDWQERSYDRAQMGFLRGSVPPAFRHLLDALRPLYPVVDDHYAYVSDGRGVRCYDLLTARERWRLDGRSGTTLPLFPPGARTFGRTSLDRVYSPVVAGGLVIATVERYRPYYPEILQGVTINTYLPHRVLVALDRETGALRWHLDLEAAERWSSAPPSVLSPPAVAEGLVVALVGSYADKHDVEMVGVDLDTGALRWRRPLGIGQQELNLFGHPLKELAATPIAVADGVAYAGTGLGFVVAVDIRSGVPRWLASYPILPVQPVDLWYATPLRTPHVATSPPVVWGDALVVAPPDGRHVHVFDRHTGRLRWREPYATEGMDYDTLGHFLGVAHDGRRAVVLLTDEMLRARDLETGKQVWYARLEPGDARVLGRGAVAGPEVLVPTWQGLSRFALDREGAFEGSTPWPAQGEQIAEAGNLVVAPRVLLVAARDTLQWLYDWPAIERDLERRRRERPDDPRVLLEAGELYLRAGAAGEVARRAFLAALALAEARGDAGALQRARQGLLEAWRREGAEASTPEQAITAWRRAMPYAATAEERVDLRARLHAALPPGSLARVENLEALVAEGGALEAVLVPEEGVVPVRAGALLLLAEEHAASGRAVPAVDALQRVLAEDPDAALPDGPAGERAQRRIAELLARWGPPVYARHEEAARALLAAARQGGDGEALDRLLARYPNAEVVGDALLLRARQLREQGRAEAAAGRLRRLLSMAPPAAVAAQALAELARAWAATGGLGAARYALARLRDHHPDETIEVDGARVRAGPYATAELERQQPVAPPPPAPLRTPLVERHFEPAGDEQHARPVPVEGDPALGPQATPPVALMNRGPELVAFDLRGGRVAWSAEVGSCQRAVWIDDLLVLAVGRTLLALDVATGAPRWRREHMLGVREMSVSQGQVFLLAQDLSDAAGTVVVAAHDAFWSLHR